MAGTDQGLALIKEAQNLGFVEFTKGLVSGVFDVVVESQMEQLQSYADLLKQVSGTVEEYQLNVSGITSSGADRTVNITDNKERLNDYITTVLLLDSGTNANYDLDEDDYNPLDRSLFQRLLSHRQACRWGNHFNYKVGVARPRL